MNNYTQNYGDETKLAHNLSQIYDTDKILTQFRLDNFNWRANNLGKEIQRLKEKKGLRNIDISNYLTEHGIKVSDTAVGNWIKNNNKNKPKRENLIGLCFAFDLTIEEADVFLRKSCFENTFHLRDYKDIIYYYCISNKEKLKKENIDSLSKALELIKKYEYLTKENNASMYTDISYTYMCKEKIIEISSEEELNAFFNDKKNISMLGSLNGSAFSYFTDNINDYKDMLNQNLNPKQPLEIEDILIDFEDFIFVDGDQNLLVKKNEHLAKLSKLFMSSRDAIEPIFKAVKNKKPIRVSRQMLILSRLLLCQNGFEDGFEDINMMLSDCGMPLLDPLSEFDFSVMNSLKSDLPIEKMQEITTFLFDFGI